MEMFKISILGEVLVGGVFCLHPSLRQQAVTQQDFLWACQISLGFVLGFSTETFFFGMACFTWSLKGT
jgi:hypothetical protein